MAPSLEYEVSSLLCGEDDTSINFEDDVYSLVNDNDDYEIIKEQLSNKFDFNQDIKFENNNGVGFCGVFLGQSQSDECLTSLFSKECHYLPGFDYLKKLNCCDLDFAARKEAIDWIESVGSHYGFGPLCLYLSVNYLDRFLASYELPKGNAWMMQLLAVACLSISAKMEETYVPLSLDLQVGETKYVFEPKAIQRMELLVLSTLEWRMQSVTPFSFIDSFLYKINGDATPPRILLFQSIQIVFNTVKGIDFLEFKSSEIAAAVAFFVLQETQLLEQSDKPYSFLNQHLEKERVVKCVEMINEMMRLNGREGSSSALTSVPQSPVGVLEAGACLSYKSDDGSPSQSCANSTHNSPPPKRRKLELDLLN